MSGAASEPDLRRLEEYVANSFLSAKSYATWEDNDVC